MASSSDSGTAGRSAGGSLRLSSVPCSVSRGLPRAGLLARAGLAALSPSLCPVTWAGGGVCLSLAATGSP
eukprot:3203530-Amphidinium_carterae.1